MANKLDKLVQKYQCPGCVYGSNPKCGSYKPDQYGCSSHVPGTWFSGVANLIVLGLPKGFNRVITRENDGKTTRVRVHTLEAKPLYDHLNVPVWAMELDGALFVRGYSPRIDCTFIDVIEGGTLADIPAGTIDVSKFINDID